MKGFVHSQLGEYKDALVCFDQVITSQKQGGDILFHKAYVLFCLKQYTECISCCDRIINNDGKCYSEARELKNQALMKCHRYEEIISSYDLRIKQDIYDTTLWYEKGVFLNKIGKYREAIDCFNHVIEIDQGDDASYYQKASALFKLALYKKALFSIIRAIELYRKENDYHILKERILLKIRNR